MSKGGGSGPLASQGHPSAAEPCPSTAFSTQEEAKAKEEEGVPDEEGWVKVTRRGRRPVLPRTEAASLRVLEKEKRKRARKELLNFYAWQHRETKMERKTYLGASPTSREQGVFSHIPHEFRIRIPVLPRVPGPESVSPQPNASILQSAEGPEGWGCLWEAVCAPHKGRQFPCCRQHPALRTFSLLV